MLRTATLALASLLVLAGCASTPPDTDDDVTRVVASTNVYGDIVSAIGGDAIEVTSVINDPSQDPHSVEVGARVQLALSKADVVIENGGGYDDFMDTMLAGSGNTSAVVLNVTKLSGLDTSGDFNEHLWYNMDVMAAIVTPIVVALSNADPNDAATFEQNAADFSDGIAAIADREAAAVDTVAGAGVAITEPVPLAMLEASGFVNRTPSAFSEAIEEGTDVSPAVLQETLDLFATGQVALLAYNEQTTGPETEQVLSAAKAASIPVVGVTETLPTGLSYLEWMNRNLDELLGAL